MSLVYTGTFELFVCGAHGTYPPARRDLAPRAALAIKRLRSLLKTFE